MPDGTEAEAAYMFDTDTGELVQVGGEGQITAEEIDLIKGIMEHAAEVNEADEEEAEDA